MDDFRLYPRRWPRRLALGATVSAIAFVGVHALLYSEFARKQVQERARHALTARLPQAVLGEDYDVGWLGSISVGPVLSSPLGAETPPVLEVRKISVRPNLTALLMGRLEPLRVRLVSVVVRTDARGERLRALFESARPAADREGPLEADRTDDASFGAAPFDVEDVRLVVDGEDGRPLTQLGPLAGGIRLSRLGSTLRAVVDCATSDGAGELHLEVERATLGAIEVTARLRGVELVFQSRRLASAPIGPLNVTASFAVRWDPKARQLQLERLHLGLGRAGETGIDLEGKATLGADPAFAVRGWASELSYPGMVAALPQELLPDATHRLAGGTLAFSAELSGPLRRPSEWILKGKLDLSKLRPYAGQSPLAKLKGEFVHHTPPRDGRSRELLVGPRNPRFVPLPTLPKWLVNAVLLSEDAAFWTHQGLDFEGIGYGLASNLGTGRVLRGGSTITQQLAKNLFLTSEKTLARKVREALDAVALEVSVPKERLLEIYLNIVEWGPGLYGIAEASRHYFDKDAQLLTPKEAAFLATILPSPVRYHGYCLRGELDQLWSERVRTLLERMFSSERLTPAQFEQAVESPLVFARPEQRARAAAGRVPATSLQSR